MGTIWSLRQNGLRSRNRTTSAPRSDKPTLMVSGRFHSSGSELVRTYPERVVSIDSDLSFATGRSEILYLPNICGMAEFHYGQKSSIGLPARLSRRIQATLSFCDAIPAPSSGTIPGQVAVFIKLRQIAAAFVFILRQSCLTTFRG